jgi:hypothetical protein
MRQKTENRNVLYETLTFSASLDYAAEHLNRLYSNEVYKINFSIKNDKILCKFVNYKKLTNDQFANLLNSINFFGYYPSFYITYNESKTGYYHLKYDESIVKKLATTAGEFLFYLVCEAKYDIEISEYELPDKLYHITDSKNKEKILRIGLVPRSKEKIYKHPDRIYFSLNMDDLDYLRHNTEFKRSTDEFSVIEFDLNALRKNKRMRFFKDENFKDKGVYTLDNVPPQFLKSIES